ncbi:CMP-N-acetylneuraminate-beta-galactosamide-alpha-2,3-sialyltransferase 4-like [Lampetra fluviatilis]
MATDGITMATVGINVVTGRVAMVTRCVPVKQHRVEVSTCPSCRTLPLHYRGNPTASRRGAVRRSRPWRSLCRSIVFPGVRGLLGLVRGPPQGTPGGHRRAPGGGMRRGLHRAVFAGLCLASLCAVYLLAANIHFPGYGSQLDCAVRRMHNPFVTWGDVARTLWGIIPLLPPLRTVDRLPYFSEGTERQYQALLRAVPDSTVPWELSRHACKRCVVVGNGFVLSNSSLGKEIDKHDIIIRMNEAPVTGYEQDVGSRTSLRLFYPESSGLERALWGQDARSTLAVFVPYKNCQVPTMGLMALGLAMHFCDDVSIAGFGYNMSALQQPVHYYSNVTMVSLLAQAGSHSIRSEQRLLRRLIAVGAITDLCSSAPRD